MRNEALFLIGIVLLVIVFAAFSFFADRSKDRKLLDEINKKFDCNRTTLDLRSTDIYCHNADLYEKDLKSGKIN